VRWLGLGLLWAGCTPGPVIPPRDTGVVFPSDTGAGGEEAMCRPVLPAVTVVITAAESLEGEGPFFICPAVPVTLVSDQARAFVAEYATATLLGARTVSYVKNGAQAFAGGRQSAIVAEPQALVSVAHASSAVEICERIWWEERWDAQCL